jgi:hypothetical protein
MAGGRSKKGGEHAYLANIFKRLPVLYGSVIYSFRGGFLIRPFLIV